MLAIKTCVLASLVTAACSKSFLGANPNGQTQMLSVVEVDSAIQRAMQAGFGLAQVSRFEAELAVLYATVPKNEHGNLEPATVRYVLHRFFAQKFHWHVTGLDPVGGSWNSSSPTDLMVNRVPSYIQGLFEKRMDGHGMGLKEVAIFAAILVDLIHQESAMDMQQVAAGMLDTNEVQLTGTHLNDLLKWYLVVYIKGAHLVGAHDRMLQMEKELEELCFTWADVKMWGEDLLHTTDDIEMFRRNPFVDEKPPLSRAVDVAREVGHRFGSFQNMECMNMKERLVDMEDEGTGRVPLTKFYSGIDNPDWPFIESKEYLRNIGSLDETDLERVTVIIPNYIGSRSFCVFPSGFYGVCCQDECEGILAGVERAVGKPLAEPEHLVRVMSNLGSDTVEAPRNLSSLQIGRLTEIAAVHGGRVALHGRLFAQWLHHAYPRECRFPHVTNTVNPMSQDEWEKSTGVSAEISDYGIATHGEMPVKHTADAELPWITAEELVAVHRAEQPRHTSSSWRMLALLIAVVSASVPLVHASKSAWTSAGDKQKCSV